MSMLGVAAVRADRAEVLALTAGLSEEEWAAPSACAGWSVRDVVAHLANTCRAVADPAALPPGVPGDLEATQDVQVAAHRDWTAERVRADYESISGRALDALERFQDPSVSGLPVQLEDAGTYPLHLVANALAFDHFCHLRNDILAPLGPVDRPAPAVDDVRVAATLEYLLAGLPQMSPEVEAVLTTPLTLRLTGAGGGEWTLARDPEGRVLAAEMQPAESVVSSAATDFIVWATRRRSWRESDVEITGDRTYAASVLDAIRLF